MKFTSCQSQSEHPGYCFIQWNTPLQFLLLLCLAGALQICVSSFLLPSDPSRWESHGQLQSFSPWPLSPGSDSAWLVVSSLGPEPEPELEKADCCLAPIILTVESNFTKKEHNLTPLTATGWGAHSNLITLHHSRRRPAATFCRHSPNYPSSAIPLSIQSAFTCCSARCITMMLQHIFTRPKINITARRWWFDITRCWD